MERMPEDEDIREVMEAEKRQTPTAKYRVTGARRKRVLASFRRALEEGDRSAFEEAILDLGLQPGSQEYEQALKAWRGFHGKRGK